MSWCVVPVLVVPGWRHAPQGECGEEEQGIQGSGDAQEAWCVVLALVVLGWGHAPQGECGDTYSTRCHRKAKKIIKDNNPLSHCLFTLLPSRRRGQCRCIKAGTERPKTFTTFLSPNS